MNGVLSEFARWDGFFGIVGSAAGALIGLQFVVMTLVAERPEFLVAEAGAAYGTPTIVHFSAALLLSVLLRVPWENTLPAVVAWGVMGFSGVIYTLIVARRMRRQTAYRPQFEDWLFHFVLPLASYLMLASAAFATESYTREALFAVGGAALLLLFTGIHNSWDAVTYHVFVHRKENKAPVSSRGKEKH